MKLWQVRRWMTGFGEFFDALWLRHTASLRFSELRRAVQAVSASYVVRRGAGAPVGALATPGKRAAYALYFGALHMLTVSALVERLGAAVGLRGTLVDLGCGTAVAGAAWAATAGGTSSIFGIEQHPWAVREARWTLRQLGLRGRIRHANAMSQRLPSSAGGIIAAYFVNELEEAARDRLLKRLLLAARRGVRVLVVEPIATRVAPWWPEWGGAFCAGGGRNDSWRFGVELDDRLQQLDRAAGLDHSELTVRTLYFPGY